MIEKQKISKEEYVAMMFKFAFESGVAKHNEYFERIKTNYGIDVINEMVEATMLDFMTQFQDNFEIV